jgi:hypothetical protein
VPLDLLRPLEGGPGSTGDRPPPRLPEAAPLHPAAHSAPPRSVQGIDILRSRTRCVKGGGQPNA